MGDGAYFSPAPCVGHSCYATETGIRSATAQVAGSVHSCCLADEVAAALVVKIGSCMFRAGFAGDHAILAVLPFIGDRPKIFGILVGMDRPGSGILVRFSSLFRVFSFSSVRVTRLLSDMLGAGR